MNSVLTLWKSEITIQGGWPKIFENGSITETPKSQKGSIAETKISPKKAFLATDFDP